MTPTVAPTVTMSANPCLWRPAAVAVWVTVDALRPDVADRAAELGLAAVLPAAEAAARDDARVKRWRVLADQIRGAEKKAAAAAAVLRRVEAARALLESEPEGDLAAKLRAVEGELAAATADEAAAEADLAQLRHLTGRHFCPAANAVLSRVGGAALAHVEALAVRREAAAAALREACARAAAAVAEVLAKIVAPAAADLLALQVAAERGWAERDAAAERVRASLCGAVPAGVTRTAGGMYVEAPAKVKAA